MSRESKAGAYVAPTLTPVGTLEQSTLDPPISLTDFEK